MKPIILSFNEADFKTFCEQAEKAKQATAKFFDGLNEICKLKLSNDLLNDLLFSRGERIAQAIEAQISNELERANISSLSIKKAAITADLEKFYTLLKSFNKPDGEIGRSLNVIDGEVAIKDKAFEDAKERYTHKITTERGKQLYEAQQDAVKALERFFKIANPDFFPVKNYPQLFAYNWEEKTIKASTGRLGWGTYAYDRIAKEPDKEIIA